jgi:integrase
MLSLAGLHISAYSFRHYAITKLLENPDVSEETAEAIAGHISHCMKRRYSHTRVEVKRAAVEALERIGQSARRGVRRVRHRRHSGDDETSREYRLHGE